MEGGGQGTGTRASVGDGGRDGCWLEEGQSQGTALKDPARRPKQCPEEGGWPWNSSAAGWAREGLNEDLLRLSVPLAARFSCHNVEEDSRTQTPRGQRCLFASPIYDPRMGYSRHIIKVC